MNNLTNAKGFSLLELAISITIIALLVASIIVGKTIKRQVQINQLMEMVGQVNHATTRFYDIYSGIAGDLWNAQSAFGSNNTQNGDGNGLLEETNSLGFNEHGLFWQHLAYAGLIKGNFDGQSQTYATPFSGSSFYVLLGPHDRVLKIGLTNTPLTSEEAANIDSVYDDGVGRTGTITATDTQTSNCLDDAGQYIMNNNEKRCGLEFVLHHY